jgi:hypothetical protein
MFPLLHGILDSNSFIPITLTFLRMTSNDVSIPGVYTPGDPISAGSWSIPGYTSYNSPGYLYFELQATGNTSSVTNYSIVSSTSSSPTYSVSNNPITVNVGNGLTYGVGVGQYYFRSVAYTSGENFYYSDGPGELARMEQINILSYAISYFPPSGIQINFSFEIVNPSSSPTSVNVWKNFETLPPPPYEQYDPYWTKSGSETLTLTESNIYSYEIYYDDALMEQYVFIRISASIGGIEYWSPLL